MADRIERIVIVGGGTAGWMSAAYLAKVFAGSKRREIAITVVESPDTPIIGVGEATIPSITSMMRALEVPEYRLFSEADATFKNAIKFVGWGGDDEAGVPRSFYHPFDPPPPMGDHNAVAHWLALRDAGVAVEPLAMATSVGATLAEGNRSPRLFANGPYEAPIPFAYHLDAVKLGQLLRSIAIERGVTHISDHVESVDQDDDGAIVAVQTRGGRDIEGDFFVDCTGFQGLLIEKVLGAAYRTYDDMLLCDRAVTCQVPLADGAAPRSFTTATAQSAGWIWEIDLTTRSGFGHVYSSRFISDDDAERALRAHIGDRAAEVPTRRIDMRVGRREAPWTRNCLAVGLSAGFLEPLESTGIHLIELALWQFSEHIAEGPGQEPMRAQYNRVMGEVYDDLADFLLAHYALNGRHGEPFWDHCREQVPLPASLVAKLQLWAYKAPSATDVPTRIKVFDGFNYFAILAGLDALPPFGGNLSPFLDLERSAEALDGFRAVRENALRASPPHEDMIKRLRASAG